MSSSSSLKRRRADEEDGEDAKLAALLEASEEYTPYVPLKQRLKGANGNGNGNGSSAAAAVAAREEQKHGRERDHEPAHGDDSGDEDAEDLEEAHRAAREKELRRREIEAQVAEAKKSLLDVQEEMKKRREHMDPTQVKLELQKQQEQRILDEVCACVRAVMLAVLVGLK